jgi:hypothetical protein
MKFEEWYKSIGGDEEDDHAFEYARSVKDASQQTWQACKKEVLKVLENYHHTPAYPYIKEALEREI